MIKQTPKQLAREPFERRLAELRDRFERPTHDGPPSAAEWELAVSLLLDLAEMLRKEQT